MRVNYQTIESEKEALKAVEAVSRAEIDVQIRTARAYPRREEGNGKWEW